MNLRDLLMQAAGMNKPQVPQGEAPAMFNNGVRPQPESQGAMFQGANDGVQSPFVLPEQADSVDSQLRRNFAPYQQAQSLRDYIRLSNY